MLSAAILSDTVRYKSFRMLEWWITTGMLFDRRMRVLGSFSDW